MQDVIAALVSLFLIGPLQDSLADRLAAAGAPQVALAEVTSCASNATPAVAGRAWNDPWWAIVTAVKLWSGRARPETVLVDAVPSCAAAVEAALPFLGERAS